MAALQSGGRDIEDMTVTITFCRHSDGSVKPNVQASGVDPDGVAALLTLALSDRVHALANKVRAARDEIAKLKSSPIWRPGKG